MKYSKEQLIKKIKEISQELKDFNEVGRSEMIELDDD
jgi:hypothetical protein